MTVEQAPNSTAALLGGLVGILTPFARQLAYGKTKAGDIALQEERNRFNTLNGSGANDPQLAREQAPRGILDSLFGSPLQRTGAPAAAAGGVSTLGLVILASLALGAYWIFKRI